MLFTIALVVYAIVASIYIKCAMDANFRDEHLSPLGQHCKLLSIIFMIVVMILGFNL
jgi:hypothetical protein